MKELQHHSYLCTSLW